MPCYPWAVQKFIRYIDSVIYLKQPRGFSTALADLIAANPKIISRLNDIMRLITNVLHNRDKSRVKARCGYVVRAILLDPGVTVTTDVNEEAFNYTLNAIKFTEGLLRVYDEDLTRRVTTTTLEFITRETLSSKSLDELSSQLASIVLVGDSGLKNPQWLSAG